MKQLFSFLILGCLVVLLSGCSLQSIKEKIISGADRVNQKDQQYEQGFTVDSTFLQEHYKKDGNYLDLANKGLTAIPDICALLSGTDVIDMRILNLAQNKIRIVDQDLSCLVNLRVLNLSYNDISSVVTLGSLPGLQELLLHKNELDSADDVTNMDLPALRKLSLAYNNLKEVGNLQKFANLTILELQHNAIEKIVGAENLEKLQELKVEFNNLTDMPFLQKLKSLKSITTEGNNLKENIATEAKAIQEKYMQSLKNFGKSLTGSLE